MSYKPQPNAIINSFVTALFEVTSSNKAIVVRVNDLPLSSNLTFDSERFDRGFCGSLSYNTIRYDLVFGDFPFGMNSEEYFWEGKRYKFPKNWICIADALRFLSDKGTAVFITEPTAFNLKNGDVFTEILHKQGFYINAIINCPEKCLVPLTHLQPVLIIISKNKTDSLFIGELIEVSQASELANNLYKSETSTRLESGINLNIDDFKNFDALKASIEVQRLSKQYKNFTQYSLKELAVEINSGKQGFTDKPNSVYVPVVGNSNVVANVDDSNIKHTNLLQVVLEDKVNNKYMAHYLSTEIGKQALMSVSTGNVIKNISKKSLGEVKIAVPPLATQLQIVQTQNKLNHIKEKIEFIYSELALNPQGSVSIEEKLDNMLAAISNLSRSDELLKIIRRGESKTIEFKESFSLDVKKQTKEKYIELSALKTIVAFINTDGGVLFIGVKDDGEISGVEDEVNKFHKGLLDNFLLHIKNNIQNRIGEAFYPFIDHTIEELNGRKVLMFNCKRSKKPCYLDQKEFYVRTNPATDKLEGPKLVEYVRNHFED